MDKPYCSDCKRVTEVVFDQSAGDTVCMDCGLVLEAHSVDESSEWRTFSGEQSGADPNRVGEASNPLLGNKVALTTIITKGNASNTDVALLGRWQNRGSNSDRNLLTAFATIATMADRLGLVSTIKDRASEIYKKVEDIKSIRGRSQDSMVAACLYIACRQEDKPRTFKEICCVANGATKREIGRATKFIVKQLEEEMGIAMDMGTIHAADLLRRFCSHLGMNNQATRAAIETVKSIEALDIRAKCTMFLGPTLVPALDPTLVSILDPTLVPTPRIAQKCKASWRLWYWWPLVDKSGTWVLFVITPSSYQKHKASWRLWYWWPVVDKSGTWVLFVIAPSSY